MSFTCDRCRERAKGSGRTTTTGRLLCFPCYDELLGTSAGLLAGGGAGGAISTSGWLARIRRTRVKKQP